MPSRIKQWLSGDRDYFTGVELYRQHGKSAALLTLFTSGSSPFSRQRLAEELGKIAAAEAPPISYEKPEYQAHELSEELQQEFQRKSRLYAEASQLHSDLLYATTNEARREIREKIIARFDEIAAIWKRGDQYILNQRNPAKQSGVSIAQLVQQRNNLRSRISKAIGRNQSDKVEKLKAELVTIENTLRTMEQTIRTHE